MKTLLSIHSPAIRLLLAAGLLLGLTSCAVDPMMVGGFGPPFPPFGGGYGSPHGHGPGSSPRITPLPSLLPGSFDPSRLTPLTPPPPAPPRRGLSDFTITDHINPDALRGAVPVRPAPRPLGRFEIPSEINPDALRRL